MSASRASRPAAVDLYAGVGGLSLGLEQAGFHVVLAVESDALTADYYRYNHPGSRTIVEPVDPHRLQAVVREELHGRELVLLAGGPPCQGFSWAGRKTMGDNRNAEIGTFVRAVLALRPQTFMLENVVGILSHGRDELDSAIRRLGGCYRLFAPTVLDASKFGVPQARRRVFLWGIREDIGVEPVLPVPEIEVGGTTTVDDALHDLPTVAAGNPEGVQGIRYRKTPRSWYAQVMRGVAEDPLDFSAPRAWDGRFCTNALATSHGATVLQRFARLGCGDRDSVSGVVRLDPEGVSPTIRAGTTAAHGARSAPRPVHPVHDRVLTTRECARLQSFPDWFLFHPTRWHGNLQVGNAVPPLLARAVARSLARALGLPSPRRRTKAIRRPYRLVRDDFPRASWLEEST